MSSSPAEEYLWEITCMVMDIANKYHQGTPDLWATLTVAESFHKQAEEGVENEKSTEKLKIIRDSLRKKMEDKGFERTVVPPRRGER